MRPFSIILLIWLLVGPINLREVSCAQPEWKQKCIYAPLPEYPPAARERGLEGSGVFVLHLNRKAGTVISVTIEKSTGSAILDDAAIACLKRWRFIRNIDVSTVKVPFTYTATGLID